MCLHRPILSIAILFVLSQLSFAQTGDWAIVKQLAPGQKVRVTTANGSASSGVVQFVSEDAIRIRKNQPSQKQDVRKIELWSPGHHGRHALIGLGVGAAAGVGIGAATGCGVHDTSNWCFVSKGEAIAILTPFFGGVGAGVGALWPSHGAWHSIYQPE